MNFYRNSHRPFFFTGPCVLESDSINKQVAEKVRSLSEKYDSTFFFKSSFQKANRTSSGSYVGPGLSKGLSILNTIKEQYNLPIITDIHESHEADEVKDVVDVIQIPAFLCRQTELLRAAGRTGKWINIKKGQFLSPQDMGYAAEKITETGNLNVSLCERGTTFGYGDLVVDFRSLDIMKMLGYPVVMDLTHSVQKPGKNGKTGGAPEFIPIMAKAAAAIGVDGFFIETHPDPQNAKSDASSQLPLNDLDKLVGMIIDIYRYCNDAGYHNA